MAKPVTFLLSLLFISSLSSVSAWVWPEGTTDPDLCKPDQVHLNLGDAYYNNFNADTMQKANTNTNATVVITWQTQEKCDNNYLIITNNSITEPFSKEISIESLSVQVLDEVIEGGQNKPTKIEGKYKSVSYTAYIPDLKPGVTYTYHIKQKNGQNYAGPFSFNLPTLTPTDEKIKFAVYGDFDTLGTNKTAESLGKMYNNSDTRFAFQVFAGDMAYDLYSRSGLSGEYFYNSMQPLYAQSPFMIVPGNHEWYKNYTFLNFRTKMPLYQQTNNHYYSFNVGKMHFIAFNYYFYDEENAETKKRMMDWLEADLTAANANRKERPWIFIFTHQPLYCSMNNPPEKETSKCYHFSKKNAMYDSIYTKHKVDFVLQGHIHYYERSIPVAKNQSQKYYSWSEAQKKTHIINPEAPIYTVEGSAGNANSMDPNKTEPMEYSVLTDMSYGYSTITLLNESAILYEHISSETGEKIDYFYVLKGDQYQGIPITPKKPSNPVIWYLIAGTIVFAIILGFIIWKRSSKRIEELSRGLVDPRVKETEIYGI